MILNCQHRVPSFIRANRVFSTSAKDWSPNTVTREVWLVVVQAEPAAHRADVGRCWEVLDGGDVLICPLGSLHCDLEPSELHRSSGKLELFW